MDTHPLPELPAVPDRDRLRAHSDEDLVRLRAALSDVHRQMDELLAPYQRHLRELGQREAEVATEQRRRQRAAVSGRRKAIQAAAGSAAMPTLADAVAGASDLPDDLLLADLPVFLSTGGECRLGFSGRPGGLTFTDGRTTTTATTWGAARVAFAEGLTFGTAQLPGVRLHLLGSRVERVVQETDVVVGDPRDQATTKSQ